MVNDMKTKIISGIKIYTFLMIYILTCCFIYSFYLMKTANNYSNITKIIIGGTTFLMIGLTYGNSIHKHGLWIGTLMGFIHLFVIKITYYLAIGEFTLELLPTIIYILCSALGGILGIFFKKIF